MTPTPGAAPHTAADAAAYMDQQARGFEAAALQEHRNGAPAKRVAATRRIAAMYENAAVTLRAMNPTPPKDDLEDLLG